MLISEELCGSHHYFFKIHRSIYFYLSIDFSNHSPKKILHGGIPNKAKNKDRPPWHPICCFGALQLLLIKKWAWATKVGSRATQVRCRATKVGHQGLGWSIFWTLDLNTDFFGRFDLNLWISAKKKSYCYSQLDYAGVTILMH